jgi:hypothetical protein
MVVDLGSWRGVICALGGTSTLYGTTERRASMTANRVDTGTVSAVNASAPTRRLIARSVPKQVNH